MSLMPVLLAITLVLQTLAPASAFALEVMDPSGLLPYAEKFMARKPALGASDLGSSATFRELQSCQWSCAESGCSPVCKKSTGLQYVNRVGALTADSIEIACDLDLPFQIPMTQWNDRTGAFIVGYLERFLGVQGITFGKLEFMKLAKGQKSVFVEADGKPRSFPALLLSLRHHGGNNAPGFLMMPLDMEIELLQISNLPAMISAIDVFELADLETGLNARMVRVYELQSVSGVPAN